MKNIRILILLTSIFLSSNTFAAPPIITTQILEVQIWGNQYFFRIENPDPINPASCDESEWVVTNNSGWAGQFDALNEQLLDALKNNSTISIAIAESYCGPGERFTPSNQFLVVRAVILESAP